MAGVGNEKHTHTHTHALWSSAGWMGQKAIHIPSFSSAGQSLFSPKSDSPTDTQTHTDFSSSKDKLLLTYTLLETTIPEAQTLTHAHADVHTLPKGRSCTFTFPFSTKQKAKSHTHNHHNSPNTNILVRSVQSSRSHSLFQVKLPPQNHPEVNRSLGEMAAAQRPLRKTPGLCPVCSSDSDPNSWSP